MGDSTEGEAGGEGGEETTGEGEGGVVEEVGAGPTLGFGSSNSFRHPRRP